jgi:hypothetical protein
MPSAAASMSQLGARPAGMDWRWAQLAARCLDAGALVSPMQARRGLVRQRQHLQLLARSHWCLCPLHFALLVPLAWPAAVDAA